jgi:Zn-dependent protease with chaperone function
MGDKYDAVMGRNRRRIIGLAAAGVMNYWIAALLFILGATLGALIAFTVEGFFNGDWDLFKTVLKGIPAATAWAIQAGWLSSTTMMFAVIGVVAFVTITAIVMMWGRLRMFERRVPRSTAMSDPTIERVAGILEAVALAAGVPAPPLTVVEDPALNSFSVGRKPESALIVVTTGLVAALTRDELEAVLAYELSRVASFDTALSTWTAGVTGRTIELYEQTDRILAKLALIVPARLARRLRARTLRRQAGQRDILALSFTRLPEALISALEKIDADLTPAASASAMNAPLWLKWPSWNAFDSLGIPSLSGRITELRALVAA